MKTTVLTMLLVLAAVGCGKDNGSGSKNSSSSSQFSNNLGQSQTKDGYLYVQQGALYFQMGSNSYPVDYQQLMSGPNAQIYNVLLNGMASNQDLRPLGYESSGSSPRRYHCRMTFTPQSYGGYGNNWGNNSGWSNTNTNNNMNQNYVLVASLIIPKD